jgi:hypothetical protein
MGSSTEGRTEHRWRAPPKEMEAGPQPDQAADPPKLTPEVAYWQNVTRSASEALKPAPPAGTSRYQNWK